MKKEQSKWIIITGLVLVLLAFIILNVAQVPYTGYVTYTENEPSKSQNCYEERIKWSSPSKPCTGTFGPGAGAICFNVACTITNDDSVGSNFKIQFKIWKKNVYISSDNYEKETYIKPFETANLEFNNLFCWERGSSTELERMDTNIIPPTKQICNEINDYKKVEKTKTETFYCSAWNKLVGKC